MATNKSLEGFVDTFDFNRGPRHAIFVATLDYFKLYAPGSPGRFLAFLKDDPMTS